jgi:deazaflavin-dependent oxidoreductase (nitroreductase family)
MYPGGFLVSSFESTDHQPLSSLARPVSGATQAPPRPKTNYHPGRGFRFASGMMTRLLRAGVPAGTNYLLTVPGRKSGVPRTNPVTVIEYEGERWLTSAFGQVDWVRNLRAAGGEATLGRGRRVEIIHAHEISPEEAAPLFKWLLNETKVPGAVRSQYLVALDAPLADYEEEARYHPVFRLDPAPIV